MTRRSTLVLSAAVSGGIGLASVLAAAPAQADTATHKDPKGDVSTISTGKGKYDTLDITSYKNTYGNQKLTLTTTVVDLAKTGWDMEWAVQDEDKNIYQGFVAADGGELIGGFFGEDGECTGAKFGTKKNTVTMTVPYTCIGKAKKVRIANYTIAQKSETKILVDDANQGELDETSSPKFAAPIAYN